MNIIFIFIGIKLQTSSQNTASIFSYAKLIVNSYKVAIYIASCYIPSNIHIGIGIVDDLVIVVAVVLSLIFISGSRYILFTSSARMFDVHLVVAGSNIKTKLKQQQKKATNPPPQWVKFRCLFAFQVK